MFSTLLSTLQSSLTGFPKPFVMSSLLPITVFVAACFGMANHLGGRLAAWSNVLNPAVKPTSDPWTFAAGTIGIMAAAFFWSGLNAFLLEVLEGKHLGWFSRWLYAGEADRLRQLDEQLEWYQRNLRTLESADGAGLRQSVHYTMKKQLRDARQTGQRLTHPDYPGTRDMRAMAWVEDSPGARAIAAVKWRRRFGLSNTRETLQPAVDALSRELAKGTSDGVKQDHVAMISSIDEARERLRYESQRLVNRRQFLFPTVSNASRGETSLTVLAPTRLGNVTRTIRSYALDRYGLDLDIFWTRLQKVATSDDKSFTNLQDAKNQVDFLVSVFWLTVIFTVLWSAVSLWVQPAPRTFLATTAAGPIVARLVYLAAVQNYLVFADLMRSEVDLFRFNLLGALHVETPPGNREETAVWQNLGGWMGYGNDNDVIFKGRT
jgi:hypothetical protein